MHRVRAVEVLEQGFDPAARPLALDAFLATVFDGITRHSPEGIAFKERSEEVGWKQAVDERDRGTYDWTEKRPINPEW